MMQMVQAAARHRKTGYTNFSDTTLFVVVY